MNPKLIDKALPVLIALIAAAVFHVSPYRASNFDIIPDSGEYAIGAHNLVTSGSYHIEINGESFPSRYPPWFSGLFLAPAYIIFGREPGNAIYPVLLLAIIGVLAAFFIGRKISGNWGGILSSLLLIFLPVYNKYSRTIMSDVPSTALTLTACYCYMQIRTANAHAGIWTFAAGGIAASLAGAVRPLLLSTVLPLILACFLPVNKERRRFKLLAVILPSTVVIAANLVYNHAVFGSPFRDGYHFWCSVPFDYSWLCFSTQYIGNNLKTVLLSPIPALVLFAIIACLLSHRLNKPEHSELSCDSPLRHITEFLLIACTPFITIHLLYFFQAERFYLPAIAILAVISGSMAARGIQSVTVLYGAGFLIILLGIAIAVHVLVPEPKPLGRIVAGQISSSTPEHSIIISSMDPVYLSFFAVKSTKRRIIPLSRNVEYASTLVCPKKILNPVPPPVSHRDLRCEGLIKAGARIIFPSTAVEIIPLLRDEALKGTPVFIEVLLLLECDLPAVRCLQNDFEMVQRGHYLYELVPKKTP